MLRFDSMHLVNWVELFWSEAKQPIQLLECLGKIMENELTAEDTTSATASSVVSSSSVVSASAAAPSHWMLTFPEQCVLTTEAIIWQRNVQHALSKNDRDLLKSYGYKPFILFGWFSFRMIVFLCRVFKVTKLFACNFLCWELCYPNSLTSCIINTSE